MSRLECVFYSALVTLVVGVLGTSSFFAYHYSQKANQRWERQWSQSYDLSIVKIGSTQNNSSQFGQQQLDTIKLVPSKSGQPIVRKRVMDPGLKLGYYDTVRFNLRTGEMQDALDVEGQGYSPPLCAVAGAIFSALALGLIFIVGFAFLNWLSEPRKRRPTCESRCY